MALHGDRSDAVAQVEHGEIALMPRRRVYTRVAIFFFGRIKMAPVISREPNELGLRIEQKDFQITASTTRSLASMSAKTLLPPP
ncbi:hypothetical protein XarbCFBP6827_19070 [Xanthomonas arboricola]|nr:hypothetical protein XarbCFBP6827_19070 [Xanthomonas arboricola]